MKLPSAIITDLDGTLAIATQRKYSDFSRVHLDTPDPMVLDILKCSVDFGRKIIVATGRPDLCRDATYSWLVDTAQLPIEMLLMRDSDDFSSDTEVKRRLFQAHIAGRYAVDLVLEDKRSVVDMWRNQGLRCYEVANSE